MSLNITLTEDRLYAPCFLRGIGTWMLLASFSYQRKVCITPGTDWSLGLWSEHPQLNIKEPEQNQVKLLHLVICSFSFHYDLDSFNLKRQLVKPRTYWTWHQSSCASLGLIKDLDMGWSTFSESPWLLPRTAAGTLQPPLPNVAVCSHSWAHRAFPASSFLPWKNVFPKVKSELGTSLGGVR